MSIRPQLFALVAALAAVPAYAQQRPDLSVTGCSASPPSVEPGELVSVAYDVVNNGDWGTATDWQDQVVLSQTRSYASSTLLWSGCKRFVNFLLPGQSYSTFNANPNVVVTIPLGLAAGTYWVGYVCNPTGRGGSPCGSTWAIGESSVSNNVRWASISIGAGPVDLTLSAPVATPSRWEPGFTVNIAGNLANRGGNTGNGSFYVDLHLSSSRTAGGTLLGRYGPFTIAGSSSLPFSTRVVVPPTVWGRYYLVAVIDSTNAVREADESNNVGSIEVPVSPLATRSIYGVGCPGTPLVLNAPRQPLIGDAQFHFTVAGADPLQAVALVVGFTRAGYPVDLTPLGMNLCALLTSPDVLLVTISPPSGAVSLMWPIPDQPWLWGVEFFGQAFSRAAQANPLGVTASGGMACRIGL